MYLTINRRLQLLGALILSASMPLLFATNAFAQAPKPRCKVANEVSPVADMLAGEAQGVALSIGIPMFIILFAGGVALAMTKRGMGFLKASFTVGLLLIFFGAIIAAVAALVSNPC